MPFPNIVIPAPHEEDRVRAADYDIVREYRAAYEREHAGEPWIEEISPGFKQRDDWRTNPNFWSIQGVRDIAEGTSEHPRIFWIVIAGLAALGQAAFLNGFFR